MSQDSDIKLSVVTYDNFDLSLFTSGYKGLKLDCYLKTSLKIPIFLPMSVHFLLQQGTVKCITFQDQREALGRRDVPGGRY